MFQPDGLVMSEDRADRVIHIQRQIIAILAGDTPAVDGQGRDRYFLLLCEEARLREEAEKEAGQAGGDPRASGAEDRTA
jgi:hypothetical protein